MNILVKLLLSLFSGKSIIGMIVIGLVLAVLLIGPRIGLTGASRFIVAGIILLIGILLIVILAIRSRREKKRNAEKIEESLVIEAEEMVDSAEQDQKQAQQRSREELFAAIATLKKSRIASGQSGEAALYVLPWYLVLGCQQTGKSSTIRNSGFRVPGAGSEELSGIGTSRNCEWWFTNQAVIMEANSRFLDSDQAQTSEMDWDALLEQLKKTRSKVPLNGIVVTVSAENLFNQSGQQLEEQALLVRRRLDVLREKLQIVCPVYVMVTKMDLVHGFDDFYANAHGAARHQIWGATFPASQTGADSLSRAFDAEYERLHDIICKRRLAALVQQESLDVKKGIYLFPLEFKSLQDRLKHYLSALCATDSLGYSPMLRGFYLTSNGGEGTPSAVVMTEASQMIGIPGGGYPATPDSDGAASQTRPFFLKGFFLNVLIPDFRLVRPTAKAAKRQKLVSFGIRAASLAIVGILAIMLVVSFVNNMRLVNQVTDLVEQSRQVSRVSGEWTDIMLELEKLDPLREKLVKLDRYDRGLPPLNLGLGMYHAQDLNREARAKYLDKMIEILFEPVNEQLEGWLGGARVSNRETYREYFKRYKVYRLLEKPAYLEDIADKDKERDAELVSRLFQEMLRNADRQHTLDDDNPKITRIADHVAFVWRHNEDLNSQVDWDCDRAIRQEANDLIREYWKPDLFYQNMIEEVNSIDEGLTLGFAGRYKFSSEQGNDHSVVRHSFTKEGWETAIHQRIADSDRQLANDWLIKEAYSDGTTRTVGPDLLEMYISDYIDAWIDFLSDAVLAPEVEISPAFRNLEELNEENSAFYNFLETAATNLDFQDIKSGDDGLDVTPMENIPTYFGALHRFWQKDKGIEGEPINIDGYRPLLTELSRDVFELQASDDTEQHVTEFSRKIMSAEEENSLAKVMDFVHQHCEINGSEHARCNDAVEKLLQRPAQMMWRTCLKVTEKYLDEVWENEIYDKYREYDLESRYPLRASSESITLLDFGNYFGNNGVVRKYLETELDKFVVLENIEPSERYGFGIEITDDARNMLLRAESFRVSLFPPGSNNPSVKFSLTPRSKNKHMGPGYEKGILLDICGTKLEFGSGARVKIPVEWPGDGEGAVIRAEHSEGAPLIERADSGEWSLFRLLQKANVDEDTRTDYTVKWIVIDNRRTHGISVSYSLRAETADNPFGIDYFAGFQCPRKLCN